MSGNYATIANTTANLNDGTPQVSILANASVKRMQERRRQSRLFNNAKGMGVGKKYPSIGTHHRNTKHVWLFSELAEVSAAYKEHHTTMPCWKITDMLYYSFSQQVEYNQAKVVQQSKVDDDDQPICQLQEPRIHLPSIQAIQTKLVDCITLQHNNDSWGYASQPTQMHKQVWDHLELAEKHRNMLKQSSAKQQDQYQDQYQDQKPASSSSTRKLLRHDFLFGTDAEFEATLPPAKRRKVVFDDEDEESAPLQRQQIKQEQEEQPDESPDIIALDLRCPPITTTTPTTTTPTTTPTMSKADIDAGITELMSLLGYSDHVRRQEHALVQQLVAQIREHNEHIGSLVSNIKDSHAEIEHHRQAISHKMQQIETIILPVPLPTPAATTHVCNKCTETIAPGVGGFSVHYADSSHPEHGTYKCDECMPLSPASRKFLEDKNAEYEAAAAPEEESYYSYSSDNWDDNWDDQTPCTQGNYYDHGEECS